MKLLYTQLSVSLFLLQAIFNAPCTPLFGLCSVCFRNLGSTIACFEKRSSKHRLFFTSIRLPFFAMCKCILFCRFFCGNVGHLAVLLKQLLAKFSTLVHKNVSLVPLPIGMRFCFMFSSLFLFPQTVFLVKYCNLFWIPFLCFLFFMYTVNYSALVTVDLYSCPA